MKQKSLLSIGVVSIGNISNAVLGLLFITAIARSLSLPEFGKYALLTSLLVAISKLIDFGSNSTYVAKSLTHENFDKNIFLTLKLMLALVAIPVSFIILKILNLLNIYTLFTFTLGLMFYGVNITFFALFQKTERFLLAVGLNTFPAIIKGIFALLILTGNFLPTLNSALNIFAISMGSCIIFYFFLKKELKELKLKLMPKDALKLFKISAPAGIDLTINNGWSALSNATANVLTNVSNVGIFSVADKFASVFALLSLSIFTVLLPKNAKRKTSVDKYEMVFLSVILLFIATVVSLIPDIGFTKIFGNTFVASEYIFKILIFAAAMTAIHTFMTNYFFIYEQTKYLMYISISKVTIFITSAVFLVSFYGLVGIAYAQLLSGIGALTLTIYFLYKLARSK